MVTASPKVDKKGQAKLTLAAGNDTKFCVDESEEWIICAKGKELLVYSLSTKQFFDSYTFDDDISCLMCTDVVRVVSGDKLVQLTINPIKVDMARPITEGWTKKMKKLALSKMEVDLKSEEQKVFLWAEEEEDSLLVVAERKKTVLLDVKGVASFNNKPLFAYNGDHVAYVTKENCLVVVKNFDIRQKIHHNFPRQRQLSSISFHPDKCSVAVSDSTGRIFISDVFDKKIVPRLIHWHSLPVESLAWSMDGQHLFSGGREAVLIKWNYDDLKREAIAPRLGASVASIVVSNRNVAVLLADDTIHFFNHQLQLLSTFSLFLALDGAKSGLFWHSATATVAYRRSKDALHFYDPRAKRDVLSLQVSSENRITGERLTKEEEEEERRRERDCLFHLSEKGHWIATTAATNDVKIWRLSAEGELKFKLSGHLHKCHGSKIVQLSIHEGSDGEATLLTASEDGLVRVWIQVEQDKWALKQSIKYKNSIPLCYSTSADFSVLAIAYEGTIALWSIKGDIELACTLSIGNGRPSSLLFPSHNNQHLLFCALDKTVLVWSLLSLEMIRKIDMPVALLKLRCLNGQVAILAGDKAFKVTNDLNVEPAKFSTKNIVDVVCDNHDNLYAINKSGQCVSSRTVEKVNRLTKQMNGLLTGVPLKESKLQKGSLNEVEILPDVDLIKPISTSLNSLLRKYV